MKGYSLEKVWDPLIRLWHWVLALVVTLGWCFGEFMSFTNIKWHFYCGYTLLGLILIRLIWGLCGPQPVRLSALFNSPRSIVAYLKNIKQRIPSGTRGHNPLGALSVIAFLILLTAQATTGLFLESEEFFETAPLFNLVSESTVWRLTWWHKLFAKCILGLVLLHVSVIFFYWIWKKENLIKPMITGWKWVRKLPSENARDTH